MDEIRSIEYFDDSWDSTNYYACINRHYIFSADRNEPSPVWRFLPLNSSQWDAVHQRIYRNGRANPVKQEDLPPHLPPPPDTIPPEALNPPEPPLPEPLLAEEFPMLTEVLERLNGATQTIYLVLMEDGYESKCGDGKFHYPEAVFFDEATATRYKSPSHNDEWTRYHLRHGTIQLIDGVLEVKVELQLFDVTDDHWVARLANDGLAKPDAGQNSCDEVEAGVQMLERRLGISVDRDDPMLGAIGLMELALQSKPGAAKDR
jgi:hypothetical protein